MDISQEEPSSFLRIPPDILLTVIEHLEPPDILSVRQCCKRLFEVSSERSIWVRLVQRQALVLPLAPELRDGKHADSLSTEEVIQVALRTHRIEELWTRRRNRILDKSTRRAVDAPKPTILLGMQVVLGRWLVLVYGEGVIQLHDIWQDDGLEPVAQIEWDRAPGSQWSSYTVTVDNANNRVLVANARCVPPYLLTIFTLNLADCAKGTGSFTLLKQLSVESPKIIHAISAERGLLAVSSTSKVQLIDMHSDKATAGNDGALIEADQDDLWNGINAVRFMGPYLLVTRTRSIELHHIETALHPTTSLKMPSLHHSFNMTTFKEFSLSDSMAKSNHAFEIGILAYDVIQGLFRYKVELHLPQPPDSLGPRLTVTQVGLYPLGLPLQTPTPSCPPSPHSSPVGTDSPTPASSGSHTRFLQTIGHLSHGTSSVTSRGFLSAFSMGSQGLRAVWIERRRGGVSREVQVWSQSLSPNVTPTAAWVYRFGAECEEMEKRVVHTINSYDLRDDIICCAFSESRGIIALGNRLGNVHILPIE